MRRPQKESPMKFRPLHDRVVIRRAEGDIKSKGGIIIPDTAKEKPQEGEVIAVGPGSRDESGKLVPLDVKAGDLILFGKWSGTEVKIDGEDLLIMKESRHHGHRREDRGGRQESRLTGRSADPSISRPNWTKIMSAKEIKFCRRRARPHAARRRTPQQRRQGDARPEGPQRRHRQGPMARRASPRTASPSPRKSSLPTSSRTWARRWCAKWPRRPTILPATAPRPRPCSPPRSCAKAPSWLPPA